VLVTGSLLVGATTEVGLIAGSIAVGGFLAHAGPALRGHSEGQLRVATVRGGLLGIAAAAAIDLLTLLL
jgi:hypothetical protein